MANTRERVKDFPSIVGTIQSDDYFPVDGATQGVRKAQVKDIMDAPITGLDTIANTTKGAINELATTAGKVWVGTQDEYDDLPDTKLTDNVLHCITDGEPSAYDSIWDKVGTDSLDTMASDCSGAINELKQSLSDKVEYINITDSKEIPTGFSSIQKSFTIPNGYNVINAVCSFGNGANSVIQAVSYFTNSAIWVNVLNQRAAAITINYTITLFIAKS